MKTIEQLLGQGPLFDIDETTCMKHAHLLSNYKMKEESFPWTKESTSVQLIFKVAFISICHQINWDFLQQRLAEYLLPKGNSIPDYLAQISGSDIENILSDYSKAERIRGKERAELLRDVGNVIKNKYDGDINIFYNKCSETRFSDKSFHNFMDVFKGYSSDPLRKKTNVLSHDLIKEKVIYFSDQENVEPAIDYHIMRLYLRTGRVVAKDNGVYRFLTGGINPRISLVKQLRLAVSEAEKLTAFFAQLKVPDVNYIEWQIGRNFCLNKEPACNYIPNKQIPEDIMILCENKCPYNAVCYALNFSPEFLEFEEPIYISKNY